ncbi:MAG: hypothetical protein ACOCO0_08145 [Prevotella sp.]
MEDDWRRKYFQQIKLVMIVLLSLNTYLLQEAIPLPLIFLGISFLLSLFVVSSIWKGTNKKELGLAVLGENQWGKTLWYDFLRNTHLGGVDTMEREYDAFDFEYDDGRKVHIKKGRDINGDRHFMSIYEKMVKDNDVIMFFNNIEQYIHNEEYRRDVNSRLDFIFHHLDLDKDKKLYIMWSYADKLADRSKGADEAKSLFLKRQIGKPTAFLVVNMTDNDEVKECAKKIFNVK